jgi:hypothetical protein
MANKKSKIKDKKSKIKDEISNNIAPLQHWSYGLKQGSVVDEGLFYADMDFDNNE